MSASARRWTTRALGELSSGVGPSPRLIREMIMAKACDSSRLIISRCAAQASFSWL
ncbi:MAG: hypothetical protein HYZ75_10965 [Elusimicrobia bacterium]|nr:hypothetical protein [Elusimicrobiota bacterium]